MLGMGILTLPYGLHISGWWLGLGMLTTFAFVAQFTAKLLAKCMQVPFPREELSETAPLLNPHRHRAVHQNSRVAQLPTSLSDVVELAFGPSSRPLISFIFMFELFAAATGLVILGADSIIAMQPSWPLLPVKICVTMFLVLTTMPRGMGWLAYGSIVGLLTLVSLFGILLYNGLSTPTTPGSLWEPATTNMWPEETSPFGSAKSMWLAAGLFCIGLDAHAVFPSIYRDLKTPAQFGTVVERSYLLNWCLYVGFASVGYIMFGTDILPQVTLNFPSIPTFNQNLTKFILVLTALNPLTKYALIMAPVNFQMEQILGIQNLSLPQSQVFAPAAGIIVRVVLGVCAVLTTIMFPTFHVLIGLVGSLFSFMIAGVIPAVCYLRLGTGNGYRQEEIVDGCKISRVEVVACIFVIVGAVCLGALGTVASIYSH
ncbi:transmembrane amino acid transporter protein-domain-containing protein [Obelidium mucronatum]|nr:transmembrane amino acid transporter protein-domain-containing protein [Obelidium mucronatum]